ncbi:MAG: DNA mismatch repair endonuclease MutL [Hormoscilla sp.]
MASEIEPLPPEVVHLIAASEVIDSMAAVVRELVENALDAGATRIAIALEPDSWGVTVADNGSGMDKDNLRQAATAHSTSKIHHCDDLWKITSLGFRGEALHSIAQLAELEICSRPASGTEGWRISYNALGEPVQEERVAIAPGTIVYVDNLFGTRAIGRQGLLSPAQQLKQVQNTIHQIALCHPHVTWQVKRSEKCLLTISPGATAKAVMPQLLRNVHWHDLQQLLVEVPPPESETQENPGKIQLVMGLPDRCHRRRPDWVKVATNGRIVKAPELEQTILAAFGRTLPRDRYPVCFLHLLISPKFIDWNRHPAKNQIYLQELEYWQAQIQGAIAQALRLTPENLPVAFHQERVGKLLKYSAPEIDYPLATDNPADTALLELQAIAQVRNTYIVAEHPGGLWLVEQHIAHERVLYEQLRDRWQIVPLEPPVILSQLTTAQLEQLGRLEMEVEPFGEQLWAVRSAPKMLHQREDIADAIVELSLGGDLQAAQVATACRSAIRNGTPLTLPEMQSILDQWKCTRNPRTCPHGRPIYLSLEETALARFFRRHWVIGKSHGI